MASQYPLRKNTIIEIEIALPSQANSNIFQIDPTIASGDFKIKDSGGVLQNLTNLPVVSPAGSPIVKITLTAAETNLDKITLWAHDQADSEWADQLITFDTATGLYDTLYSNIVSIKAKTDNLPSAIKKNTALNGFTFKMVDDNGDPATGLTITAQRSQNAGAFSSTDNSVSEISSGWYSLNLTANDTNCNTLALEFSATGAKTRSFSIVVQS